MKFRLSKIVFLTVLMALPPAVAAQTKKKPTPKRPVPVVAATPAPTPATVPETPPKKNERPDDVKANGRDGQKNAASNTKGYTPVYFYSFDRPGFTYSQIFIEHDDAGKGQISFKKDAYNELWIDPIQLSPVTMANLKTVFAALNFLDSAEDYQYAAHDFSNMGNVTITLKQNGKERIAKYNWTDNKDAKFLMDEYRRIGNEYTWKFEIAVARENQPLLTPGMMDALDGYYKRNELSDPPHLVAFLTELSTDERLPLIARNRAVKLVKLIEKVAKK